MSVKNNLVCCIFTSVNQYHNNAGDWRPLLDSSLPLRSVTHTNKNQVLTLLTCWNVFYMLQDMKYQEWNKQSMPLVSSSTWDLKWTNGSFRQPGFHTSHTFYIVIAELGRQLILFITVTFLTWYSISALHETLYNSPSLEFLISEKKKPQWGNCGTKM